MSISSSIEDNTKSHNIITLHHDVRSPNTASMIITGTVSFQFTSKKKINKPFD